MHNVCCCPGQLVVLLMQSLVQQARRSYRNAPVVAGHVLPASPASAESSFCCSQVVGGSGGLYTTTFHDRHYIIIFGLNLTLFYVVQTFVQRVYIWRQQASKQQRCCWTTPTVALIFFSQLLPTFVVSTELPCPCPAH